MKTVTPDEFLEMMKATGAPSADLVPFVCPKCKTPQTATDLIAAGAGADFDEVERFLGFSCIGRFDPTKGCDWTLGGLFKIHLLEISDGTKTRPCFELGVYHPRQITHPAPRPHTSAVGRKPRSNHMRTDEEIAYFLSFSTNQTSFSTAGMAAARFIEKVWGLHNANVNLSKINFAHPENIRFSLTTGGLATVDYNELTRMVVIAHDMVLRLEIQPASPRQLRVILSLRQRESKRFWEMCPTIEEHIATIRK